MNFGSGCLHFYFGDHWGVVIFAGTAFVAQMGCILYLHRRYRKLSAKYIALSNETNDLRNSLHSLRSVVVHVEDTITSAEPVATYLPPYCRSSSDNQPRTSLQHSNPTSSSHISSLESVYIDAIDEQLAAISALNISAASAVSASELLAMGSQPDAAVVTTSQKSQEFELIDQFLEQNESKQALDECKKLYDSSPENQNNVELLWRYAKACYSVSTTIVNDNAQKKKLLQEGQKYAVEGTKIDENNYNAVKFAAVTTGSLTDYLGTKDKIQQGYEFKRFLDKALSVKSTDHTLLHMRGRFSYSVASLSWLERKAATALFAEPPKATYDEAIADFLEVEKLIPGTWIENLFYLAKCYLAKNEKQLATDCLNKLIKLNPTDESEKALIAEARALLAKHLK